MSNRLPHAPNPEPGVEPKTITMRREGWDPDVLVDVTLRQRKVYVEGLDHDFDVHTSDGTWIGSVERYTGSLDRKMGRLRHPGKRRHLWKAQAAGWDRALFDFVSRAEAIRRLLSAHERTQREAGRD